MFRPTSLHEVYILKSLKVRLCPRFDKNASEMKYHVNGKVSVQHVTCVPLYRCPSSSSDHSHGCSRDNACRGERRAHDFWGREDQEQESAPSGEGQAEEGDDDERGACACMALR
jgi:hypothetical protein